MAFRVSRRVRATGVAATLLAAVTVPTVAGATPRATPAPAPTIQSVQQQLGKLALENDQQVERYNQATIAYRSARVSASKAADNAHLAAVKVSTARHQLSASAAAAYEGGSFSAAGALLSSESGASYLDKLDTLSMLSSHNAQVLSWYATSQQEARNAKSEADRLYAKAKTTREKLAAQRIKTEQQIDRYKKLLASLNAKQRAAWAAQASPTVPLKRIKTVQVKVAHITSSAVQTAVAFALQQVGKPYVYGAAGPGSFDCSGLTMSAYGAAGISLPHSAASQFNYGHHVDASALQPGDLLFYYQPIGHVSIYVGNGMMVSAPQTGENVKVIPADTSNGFTGATRLVG